jgi:hypothetical protein
LRITFLGQAGLFIETKHGTILCDPWFNPAYFASWFPFPSNEVKAIFTQKRAYLEAYQERQRPLIEAAKASWPRGQVDILSSLRDWFEPLLEHADLTCVGINGRLLIDCGEQALVIDFQKRKVYPWNNEEWEYRFQIDPALIESSITRHVEGWVNDLFLSCRFKAERKGPYNEYIYIFFKGLSPERIQYIEGYYAEQTPEHQFFESNGYRIQRRCPHLKADLTRFGKIEDRSSPAPCTAGNLRLPAANASPPTTASFTRSPLPKMEQRRAKSNKSGSSPPPSNANIAGTCRPKKKARANKKRKLYRACASY